MKRVISVILLLCLSLTLLAGCKGDDGALFEYEDISKYVTVGNVIGLTYKLSVEPVTQAAIDSFVNDALSDKGYGTETEVTDRPVQTGDTVNIAFVGKKDGVAFEGGTSSSYDLTIGSGAFIDGFEDGLIGATVGEKRDLDLTFPENYGNEELNGAAVVFEVTVNSIKTTVYPELTDTLVQEISDSTTVDEYLEYANGQVLSSNQQAAQENANNDIWAQAVKGIEFIELPEKEYEYFEEVSREYYESIATSNGMTIDQLIAQSGLTEEQYEEEVAASAKGYTEYYLANVAIARDQDLEITDEEYETAIQNYATQYSYASAKEAEEAIDVELFRLSLLGEKVLNYLVENAVESEA